MNIKTLRKSYENLTMIERHSLFLSAVLRKDDSEEDAIVAASPTKVYEMPDFTVLYSKILSLQMMVLIYKAEAWQNWKIFSDMEIERADNHSRLALYFYYVYSDAWEAVCEKLNINGKDLAEKMFPGCFIFQRIFIDEVFRKDAFTEAEAREFIGAKVDTEKFAMTLESQIKEFLDFLELPKK